MRTIQITQNEEVKCEKFTWEITECPRTKAQKWSRKNFALQKTNTFTIIASNFVREN